MKALKSAWAAGLLVLVMLAAIGALLVAALGHDPNQVNSVLVGRGAPDFQLRALDGSGSVRLSDLRGQVVLLNFWASWCAECRNEEPVLKEAVKQYQDRGVVLLGISFQDQDALALRYGLQSGLDWPLLADPDSRTALAYGVGGIPETFLIDSQGRVAFKQPSRLTSAIVARQLAPLLRQAGR